MSNDNSGAAIAFLIGGAVLIAAYASVRVHVRRTRRHREQELRNEVVIPTERMFGIKPEYVSALATSNRLPRLEKGSLILGRHLVPISAANTQYLYHVEAVLVSGPAEMYQIITVTKGINSAPANTV